jgi:hypothetical protein
MIERSMGGPHEAGHDGALILLVTVDLISTGHPMLSSLRRHRVTCCHDAVLDVAG